MFKKLFTLLFLMFVVFFSFSCGEGGGEHQQEPSVEYTITFNVDGVETKVDVKEGEKVAKPSDPIKEGYIFDGWFIGSEEYDFDKTVFSDLTLTAKFEEVIVEYLVIFIVDGVETEVNVKEGECVEKPNDPVKEGYTFNGWFLDEEEYNFETPINKNITLIAQFEVYIDKAPEFIDQLDKENVSVNWNGEYDLLYGLTVIDTEDGDITSSVEVLNDIDNKKYGVQEVKYTVTDSKGNEVQYTRNYNVVWNYKVQFIGHKGSFYGVENTEEAFIYAAEVLQYQMLECDIKQTSDGVFVLWHDDNFAGYNIASTSYDFLKDITIKQTRNDGYPAQNGSVVTPTYESKICTLERYLQICKQYNVTAVIELKTSKGIDNGDQSRMQALMDVIEKEQMLDNVVLITSLYQCLIWTRMNGYSYIPCHFLVVTIKSDRWFDICTENNIDISFNALSDQNINCDDWIEKYHKAGLEVSTYTFSQYVSYDVLQKWIDKGVDYVTSDWHEMDKLNLPEKESLYPPKTIEIIAPKSEIEVNESMTLSINASPAGTNKQVIWSSSDKSIASIDVKGNVVGKAPGEVTITAKSKLDNSIICKYNIVVVPEIVVDSSVVYVSEEYVDNGSEITIDGKEYIIGKNALNSIGEAVRRVAANGVIYVNDGSYSGDIVINKPCKIIASGNVVVSGLVTISNGVNGLEINGIKFTGSSGIITTGEATDVYENIVIKDCIFDNVSSGADATILFTGLVNNIKFENNEFSVITSRGVRFEKKVTDIDFIGNKISGSSSTIDLFRGMTLVSGNVNIINNVFDTCTQTAIQFENVTETTIFTISKNIFKNIENSSIDVRTYSGDFSKADIQFVITYNQFIDGENSWGTIRLRAAGLTKEQISAKINYNKFKNVPLDETGKNYNNFYIQNAGADVAYKYVNADYNYSDIRPTPTDATIDNVGESFKNWYKTESEIDEVIKNAK